MSPKNPLTIGRLAVTVGVKLETIRYYERIGLMPPPGRTAGGHRQYLPEHRARLAFIRRARALGFRLEEIRALIAHSGAQRSSCAQVRDIAASHVDTVRAKIADLQRLALVLDDAVGQCGAADAALCPVIEVLSQPA